ncbi:MAG TPA: hypothetical protein VFW90_02015 [Candidatus Saccharimonadales bacterium]|nr:hypothetical protein [Candidatus Saccharimonadales bacterium]
MELRPDEHGRLVARPEDGQAFFALTKSSEGAGLVRRRPLSAVLTGPVIEDYISSGENLASVLEKISARNRHEPGSLRFMEGVVVLVPVYNEKLRREEWLRVKDNHLLEAPIH